MWVCFLLLFDLSPFNHFKWAQSTNPPFWAHPIPCSNQRMWITSIILKFNKCIEFEYLQINHDMIYNHDICSSSMLIVQAHKCYLKQLKIFKFSQCFIGLILNKFWSLEISIIHLLFPVYRIDDEGLINFQSVCLDTDAVILHGWSAL